MRFLFLLAACLLLSASVSAKTYYVSISGDDLNPGTLEGPFKSISKAVGLAVPGDTILVRGDTFSVVTAINISRSGASGNPCYLLAYPGERPLLDCSAMALGPRGINLSGSYWYIKGLDIARAGDNGMCITGSNNVVEFCSFCGNRDSGLQLYNGASHNRILNCDSYDNADPTNENADGFSPKLSVGSGNYFYGCRSWQNCDDGWDGYLRDVNGVTTTIENCWSFKNGYLSDGTPSIPNGDGNGFKMGGSDNKLLEHNMTLHNCLAFDNRVKGYDQNSNKGSMTLLNCTAYRNDVGGSNRNFSISQSLDSGMTLTVMNCVALGSYGTLGAFAVQGTNSWMNPFSVSAEDFLSIDTAGVRGPRKPDGSLPDVPFMHLASGSDLINAGTDVGLAYNGLAPDLGAFEMEEPAAVKEIASAPADYALLQNWPNPFNPTTTIKYTIGGVVALSGAPLSGVEGRISANVRVAVCDILGREVAVLVNERKASGSYEVTFDGSALTSGVYFYRLTAGLPDRQAGLPAGQAGSFSQTRRMVLLK